MQFDPVTRIAIVKTGGEADARSSGAMILPIMKFMKKNGCMHCLIDHSELNIVTGKTLDIYQRPDAILRSGTPGRVKIAAVIQKVHQPHFHFLETVSLNRGLNYRTFFDLQEAREWLLG